MSWIKTSFLWMMYRSGWATKPGQEVVLAVWLRRAGFEAILAEAVPSTCDPANHRNGTTWSAAVARSTVRLQWDPDRTPGGRPLGRRSFSLGGAAGCWPAMPRSGHCTLRTSPISCASRRSASSRRKHARACSCHASRSTGQPTLKRQLTVVARAGRNGIAPGGGPTLRGRNEMVYRTRLRTTCAIPASSLKPFVHCRPPE